MENPFEVLSQRIQHLEGMIGQLLMLMKDVSLTQPASETPIRIKEAAQMLDLAESTIYQNTSVIPCFKRNNKLYFYPSQLRAYIESGTKLPSAQVDTPLIQPRKTRRRNPISS